MWGWLWRSLRRMNHPTRRLGWVAAHGGDRFIIDLRDHGRISSLDGVTFRGEEGRVLAVGILAAIESAVRRGEPVAEVVDRYRPRARTALVPAAVARFIAHFEQLVAAKERSPTTLRGYRIIERHDLGWWSSTAIHDVTFARLEDWNDYLASEGNSPKTRRNKLALLHGTLQWCVRRGEMRAAPPFPSVEVPEHMPNVLPKAVADSILDAIPEPERGPYLLASRMGLRPGEVRALDVADVDRTRDPWRLRVTKAVQGPKSDDPIGPTKNKQWRVLPIHPDVREWLDANIDWTGRLVRAPLFVLPRSKKRLSHWSFRKRWWTAREGVTTASLYEGTKHTMASDAVNRGIGMEHIRKMLGHSDQRSTERYARLRDESLDVFTKR